MKLPSLQYPTYDVKLLSQPKPVKIRPFTVREEQLMLMVAESPDLKSTVDCLKQIISNCVIGDYDVEKMSMIDMETLFLNLRARSIGETGEATFKCLNKVDDKECGMVIQYPINFLEIPIENSNREKKIMLEDDVGILMRYPTVNLMNKLTEPNFELEAAVDCTEMIFDKDAVYHTKDCTEEELKEFYLNLLGDKYEKVKDFVNNTPKTKLETKKTCTKCGYEHTFVLEGIEDFFV